MKRSRLAPPKWRVLKLGPWWVVRKPNGKLLGSQSDVGRPGDAHLFRDWSTALATAIRHAERSWVSR